MKYLVYEGVKLIPVVRSRTELLKRPKTVSRCSGCFFKSDVDGYPESRCAISKLDRNEVYRDCMNGVVHWLPETPEVIAEHVAQILEGTIK